MMLTQTVQQFEGMYQAKMENLDLEARPYEGGWILTADCSLVLASARNPTQPRRFASLDALVKQVKAKWPQAELSIQLWER
jgi:hypothetical protein